MLNSALVDASVEMAQLHNAKLFFLNVVGVDLDSSMIDRFKKLKTEYVQLANDQLQHIVKDKVAYRDFLLSRIREIKADFLKAYLAN